ncbi:hypothetical protein [Rhizobium sp. RU36D]|uniref:hypothetical protein n=1 Tax=Rhizobium sp. RU36D TaxID=1907415 RepID=UPI0009D80898|nr:hypothetical protein [Rhizobium sp. RU36D]SMD18567.1 hypothetical protein SAMN05880593_13533 [Rhizobium sp. RU36D]
MRDVIRLVTEDPGRAFWQALRCTPSGAPSWVVAISNPHEIMIIPDGVKCLGIWFSSRKFRSDAEDAWVARRLMGGIVALEDADWERMAAWTPGGDAAEMPHLNTPQLKTPPKQEISDLVQSQRWI